MISIIDFWTSSLPLCFDTATSTRVCCAVVVFTVAACPWLTCALFARCNCRHLLAHSLRMPNGYWLLHFATYLTQCRSITSFLAGNCARQNRTDETTFPLSHRVDEISLAATSNSITMVNTHHEHTKTSIQNECTNWMCTIYLHCHSALYFSSAFRCIARMRWLTPLLSRFICLNELCMPWDSQLTVAGTTFCFSR